MSGIYTYHTGTGQSLIDRVYQFEANSNVSKIWNYPDQGRSQNFTYDKLNRIKTAWTDAATGPTAWGQQYVIDAWGNLTKQLAYDATRANPTPLDQSATEQNRLTSFSYDAAGNMTQNGSTNYAYDAENRITSTSGYTYTYDANGMRVRKQTDASNFTEYIYFGSEVIAEKQVIAGGAAAWADYIFAGGKRIAKAPGVIATTGTEYYHSDHLGSARLMTNASGGPVPNSDATFLPYGQEFNATSTATHYKFTGKERDSESGLDYFGARYYGSNMGRFLSPDEFTGGPVDVIDNDPTPPGPLPYADITNPQSLNKYSYTYNNPLRYTDPDGHCPVCPDIEELAQDAHEVARVAGPLVASAAGAVGTAVTTAVIAPIALAASGGIAIQSVASKTQAEADYVMQAAGAANDVALRNQQQKQQQQAQPPAPQAAAEHDKGKRKSTKDDHERRRPGTSPPPNYKPDRKYKQPKDDKKKDKEKPPYHRKDRDKKTD